MSLLCSEGSDEPACCDWSTTYSSDFAISIHAFKYLFKPNIHSQHFAAMLCTNLGLFDLQVFPILYGEINVLQDDVDALLISAIKGQEANHTVVINLEETVPFQLFILCLQIV